MPSLKSLPARAMLLVAAPAEGGIALRNSSLSHSSVLRWYRDEPLSSLPGTHFILACKKLWGQQAAENIDGDHLPVSNKVSAGGAEQKYPAPFVPSSLGP